MLRTPALKRYNKRVIWLSLVYVIFLFAAVYGFNHELLHGAAAYMAAVLPALPIIGVFGAIGRYLVEEPDEYVRMLMVRQSLWASGFALSVATVWGFLESFKVVPHVESWMTVPVWAIGLGIAQIWQRVRGS